MMYLARPRRALPTLGLAASLLAARPARAQDTAIKFPLDRRFEGPSACFLLPVAQGHFKAEKLDVTVDAGNGSGNAVNRVASGAYDMGFADLAALMAFHANNPTAPNKPVAVMMVYNDTPAAVFSLKKTGIKAPADGTGKKRGAPVFDAGRRAFPIVQKANGIGAVQWVSMDPPLRETLLVKARDGIVNAALEERRLRLAIDSAVATPEARAEDFGAVSGPRLALMASQVADAYATKGRIDPDAVWNGSLLPSAAERDLFAGVKPAKQ